MSAKDHMQSKRHPKGIHIVCTGSNVVYESICIKGRKILESDLRGCFVKVNILKITFGLRRFKGVTSAAYFITGHEQTQFHWVLFNVLLCILVFQGSTLSELIYKMLI